jgi:hypothetical protein
VNRVVLAFVVCIFSEPTICEQLHGSTLFDQVSPWLPSNMEALYVTNMPIKGLSPRGMSPRGNELNLDGYARLAVSAVPEAETADAIGDALANFDASDALYIGREFRVVDTPGGLGVRGRFEGCSFLRSSHPAVDAVLSSLDTKHIERLRGVAIYRFLPAKDRLNPTTVAAPEPDLLMICTDRSLMEEILIRKKDGSPRVAFPALDFANDGIDTNALAWGFREFRSAKADLTSPLNSAQGFLPQYKDSKAVAMAFSLESKSLARVIYLTAEVRAASRYEQTWEIKSRSIEQQRRGGLTVITMEFDPSQDSTGQMRARVLLLLLGIILVV